MCLVLDGLFFTLLAFSQEFVIFCTLSIVLSGNRAGAFTRVLCVSLGFNGVHTHCTGDRSCSVGAHRGHCTGFLVQEGI